MTYWCQFSSVPRDMLLPCSLLADHLHINASLEESTAVSSEPCTSQECTPKCINFLCCAAILD